MKNNVNEFGEFLLNIMKAREEDIDTMADRLNISKSYLYYLISGKRSCSDSLKRKLIEYYQLNDKMIETLDDCIARSKNVIKIDLSSIDDYEFRKVIIKLVHEIPSMSDDKIKEITNILKNSGDK